jgi:sulfur-oxidizing protein SoxA
VYPQVPADVLSTSLRHSGSLDMSPSLQAMQADDMQNPAMLWVTAGRERWALECASCHGSGAGASPLRGVATRYPAWDATLGRVLTLNQRIRHCRSRRADTAVRSPVPPSTSDHVTETARRDAAIAGTVPASAAGSVAMAERDNMADSENVLSLQAFVAFQSRGMALQPAQDAATLALARQGAALFQRRLGALELSCADCHEQRAGLRLGGSVIPQGHPTGYPLYRLEWQGLGSLARRLRSCVTGVRATPFDADGVEMLALEAWLMRRAAGMAMDAPGLRP